MGNVALPSNWNSMTTAQKQAWLQQIEPGVSFLPSNQITAPAATPASGGGAGVSGASGNSAGSQAVSQGLSGAQTGISTIFQVKGQQSANKIQAAQAAANEKSTATNAALQKKLAADSRQNTLADRQQDKIDRAQDTVAADQRQLGQAQLKQNSINTASEATIADANANIDANINSYVSNADAILRSDANTLNSLAAKYPGAFTVTQGNVLTGDPGFSITNVNPKIMSKMSADDMALFNSKSTEYTKLGNMANDTDTPWSEVSDLKDSNRPFELDIKTATQNEQAAQADVDLAKGNLSVDQGRLNNLQNGVGSTPSNQGPLLKTVSDTDTSVDGSASASGNDLIAGNSGGYDVDAIKSMADADIAKMNAAYPGGSPYEEVASNGQVPLVPKGAASATPDRTYPTESGNLEGWGGASGFFGGGVGLGLSIANGNIAGAVTSGAAIMGGVWAMSDAMFKASPTGYFGDFVKGSFGSFVNKIPVLRNIMQFVYLHPIIAGAIAVAAIVAIAMLFRKKATPAEQQFENFDNLTVFSTGKVLALASTAAFMAMGYNINQPVGSLSSSGIQIPTTSLKTALASGLSNIDGSAYSNGDIPYGTPIVLKGQGSNGGDEVMVITQNGTAGGTAMDSVKTYDLGARSFAKGTDPTGAYVPFFKNGQVNNAAVVATGGQMAILKANPTQSGSAVAGSLDKTGVTTNN